MNRNRVTPNVFTCAACLTACLLAQEMRADVVLEPTVTPEESRLIQTAMGVASTNTACALQFLRQADSGAKGPAVDFVIGNLCFQDGRLDEAVTAYRAALARFPRFRSAIMNLGRVHLLQGQTGETITLYQRLIADGQADAGVLLLFGHALLLEACPVSAESAYRQALLLQPRQPEARLGLAKAVMRQERFPEGLALVTELLQAAPADRELWALRANACLSMGNEGAALHALETARRLGCADAEMLATLGDLLLNRNRPDDALEAYQRAFEGAAPSADRLLRAIEGLLLARDSGGARTMIARAEALLQQATEAPDLKRRTTFLRLKAEAARQDARMDEALRLCEETITLDPLDGHALLLLAELQSHLGRAEEAVLTCERAARVTGFEADARVRQAQIEVAREHYARAVSLLEAAQTFRNQPHVARYIEQIRRMRTH